MKDLPSNSKINSSHLERKAIVYLRQSSEKQAKYNLESQRLQYSLVDKAKEYGWRKIEVIDTDLGSSAGMGAAAREGFDQLIASVAKGEAGIVLSSEISRLSRTDKDWCRLLEVCQIFGTLIGDVDQVYDLNELDDQLILGIKGTLSVVELKVLKMRLLAGAEQKARRGEMIRLLPPGYIKDKDGKAVMDPSARIRNAIRLIFKKFAELWSIRQTFLYFHAEGLELPVNKSVNGKIGIVWQLPTRSFIKDVLINPFYAGAYVYGRRQTQKVVENGKVVKRTGGILPPEQCKVFIRNHHKAYIDWETYERNQEMIRKNNLNLGQDESAGAVRAGQGLLSGIVRCGRCGRKLNVRYWGKSGTNARYLCKGDFDNGGKHCLGFGGGMVDRRFEEEILKVISPFGVRAGMEAIKRMGGKNSGRVEAVKKQIAQAEYEAMRAFEQYDEVDPRNRLVALELERRWNEKLEEVERLKVLLSEIEDEKTAFSEVEEKRVEELGENFKIVWRSKFCTSEMKKKIVRTIVEEVVANSNDSEDKLVFVIHWKGGSHTRFEMDRPRSGAGQKTSMEDLDVIRKMGVRYGDDEIARVLNKLGRKTGKGKRWNEQRVKTIRYRSSIPGQKRTKPDPDILTLQKAAKYCNVSQSTIKKLVSKGVLKKEQIVPWAPWEIKRSDLDSERIQYVLKNLRETGKLRIKGDDSQVQCKYSVNTP